MPSIISMNSIISAPSSDAKISEVDKVDILSALSFTPSFDSQDGQANGDGKVLKLKNDNNDDSVCSSSIESTVEDVEDNDGSLNHSLSDELSFSSLDESFRPCTNQATFTFSKPNSLSDVRRRSCMSIRTLEQSINKEKYSECMNQARERKSLRFENSRRNDKNDNDKNDKAMNVYDELRSSLAKFKVENKMESERSEKSKSEASENSSKGSVSFHSVSIQLYPIILGFNPAVSKGPPITMDWHPFAECCVPVDTYEAKRSGDGSEGASEGESTSSSTRRRKKDLKISSEERFDILQRCGEKYEKVRHRTKEIKWIQDYRTETVAKSHSKFDSDMEEKLEGIKRKCRKMFLGSQYADKMRTKKVIRENKRVEGKSK